MGRRTLRCRRYQSPAALFRTPRWSCAETGNCQGHDHEPECRSQPAVGHRLGGRWTQIRERLFTANLRTRWIHRNALLARPEEGPELRTADDETGGAIGKASNPPGIRAGL